VRSALTTTRYGIHGMREEHFGMAPAEMVRAGMIVWVPNGGGQVEIVGDAPRLRFATDDEAVDAILGIIDDPREEQRLREHLAVQGERFSTERFTTAVRNIVESFRE
jgi:glycosyltransferase involved in cell wall biosynthesis